MKILVLFILSALTAQAQLAVTVTPPKVVGQKAVVQLKMKNDLGGAVKSARAVCFLLDEQGKLVGQSTKWVIGENHASLEPKAEKTFNFVVTNLQPFRTTNLTAKVSFVRVILAGGQLADPTKDIIVEQPKKN